MSDDVGQGNGNQHRQENVVDLRRLRVRAVEKDGEESNGNVEDLAGYFMPVNLEGLSGGVVQPCVACPTYKRSPLLVNGNKAQRAGAPAHLSPVVLVRRRRRQVPVGHAARQRQVLLHGAVHLPAGGQAAHSAASSYFVESRAPASGARPRVRIRAGLVFVDWWW